jgi:hypothetical protein
MEFNGERLKKRLDLSTRREQIEEEKEGGKKRPSTSHPNNYSQSECGQIQQQLVGIHLVG